MEVAHVDEAVELLEKAIANLEPELLSADAASELLVAYARAKKLASYGEAALARKLDDAGRLARISGTSIGKAKETIATGKVLNSSHDLSEALRSGNISLDQASEIARAEEARPGASAELLSVAANESFGVLKEKARKVKLESQGQPEPYERYLADAYAALLAGVRKGRTRRPELVVLVSHEVTQRGWKDVRKGEVCKIPGVGPISPEIAKQIAKDAFLNGVFYDGVDLRHFKRWTRHIPIEVAIALELGDPPEFDGVRCVDCGHRWHTEFDHVEPCAARGPTSKPNVKPRCWGCHKVKTDLDRKNGKLTPPEP